MKRLVFGALVLATGCGNASDLLGVPRRQKPIAVIHAPAGPLAALSAYDADGTASHDPDGQVVAWHWSITQKPQGSAMTLVPSAGSPASETVKFNPDLLGAYEITLVVTDNDGQDSDPAVYDFNSLDNSGLRLELTWDMNYVDVDLHLIDESQGGTFFNVPYDAFFKTFVDLAPNAPDWGVAGVSDDDPAVADPLTFDHDEGFGPEVMGIRVPAAGNYRVMAHYYCDDTFGGTTTDLKVYAGGALLAEATRSLVHTGDLWDIAGIVVDSAGTVSLTMSTAGIATTTHGCTL